MPESFQEDELSEIVVQINDRWRVTDDQRPYPYRQWILERRGGTQWHGLSFCQNRATLERDVRRRVGDIGEDAKRALAALPDRNLGHLDAGILSS